MAEPEVDPHVLARAASRVWSFRQRFELEAASRFARLADQLSTLGAHPRVVALTREAASDELRHASDCLQLVVHFGGDVPETRDEPATRVAPAELGRREAVLYEVVAMSCVTETLSCALLGALVERARDPRVRQVMHAILRDEVRHSQLGWAHLEAERERIPVALLADYLPAMLSATVQEELFISRDDHPLEEPLSGLGALSRKQRLTVFDRSMHEVVLPGLERYGVDTSQGARWLKTQLAGAL